MGDRLDMGASLAPASNSYSFAGEANVALPDTMAVPSSFAGPTPSSSMSASTLPEGSYQVASLPTASDAEPDIEPRVRRAEPKVQPAMFPPAPVEPEEPVQKTRPLRGATSNPQLDALISKYAEMYDVPEGLVRRVVKRESNFNPAAYNRGHWGLMQIKHATARGMGYDGPAKGLLDAETNLKYSVKYLRGAYMVAQGNQDRADRLYQRGYYYDAKRMGLLDETGLGRDRKRRRG